MAISPTNTLESIVYRINAGGADLVAIDSGPDWTGDLALENASGPVSVTGDVEHEFISKMTDTEDEVTFTNPDVAAIAPWQLFIHERFDKIRPLPNADAPLAYNFDVEIDATYKITLLYVENRTGAFRLPQNDRVFDVTADGAAFAEFADLNPLGEAAAALGQELPPTPSNKVAKQPFLGTVLTRELVYTAVDDELNLTFLHNNQNPKINAIQISQILDEVTDIALSSNTVAENAADAAVGELSVVGADAGDGYVFTVSDDRFQVVDGVLKLKAKTSLDFEEAYEISLAVTATADGVSVTEDLEIAVQDVGENRLSAVTNVVEGSRASETLKGTKADDLILGFAGKDTLIGRKGDDIMTGGKGADDFVGGKGFDTLDYSDSAKGVMVNLRKGVARGGEARGDKFKGMEGVIGSEGDDKLLGSKAGNLLIGGEGDDVLKGRRGSDVFIFGPGNDKMLGGKGHDTVVFDGDVGDFDMSFGEKVTVTLDSDGSVLRGMERLEFDDTTYVRDGGSWDDLTAIVLSIADAPTLVEAGDTGTTDLAFGLSLDDTGFNGTLQVAYNTGTATNQSQSVSFAGGVGTLVVPVANDDVDNGTETVAVTLTGASGTGVTATLGTTTASGMVTEDDVIAIVLSIADAPTLTETGDTGTTDLAFGLSLDDTGFSGTLQVAYNTGTATNQSQSVSFAGGVGTLVVPVANDNVDNGTETVAVTLTGASGTGVTATLGTTTASGMVTEDDVIAIVLSIADAPTLVEAGDTGTTDLAFGLSLDDTGFSGTLQVAYNTGTATNQSQSVSFAGGVGTLVVPVANDDVDNGTETVAVTLTGATGTGVTATLGTTTASGMVTEDDVIAIVLSIADAPMLVEAGDTGTTDLTFGLSLDDTGFSGDLQVGFDVGAATGQTRTVSFVGGIGTLTVPVANDDVDNGTETVAVTLTGATGTGVTATLGTATATGMVTEDDVIAIVLSIADAPMLVEAGDTGTTDVTFGLSLDDTGFSGDLQVGFDVGAATGQTRTVSFAGGIGRLTVPVANDDVDNGTETVAVTLTGATGTGVTATLGTTTASGMVTEDDLTAIVLSVADAPTLVEVGDTGTTDLTFGLSLDDSGFSGDLEVGFDVGAATGQTRTVSFVGGIGTLVVPVANDDVDNGTETVAVTLTGATGTGVTATLGTTTASGMVTEDDLTAIVLSIADAPTLVEVGDTGTTDLTFGLSLDDSGFSGDLQVGFDVGAATGQTRTVSFRGGVGTLTVPVANDDVDNGTETVAVTLTGATGTGVTATLGTATASGMVTEDDVTAPPEPPTGALEAFAAQDDLDTAQSYASGTIGSAKLAIMLGNNNIEASNFAASSFKVTNTGDKKISAIFIDVSGALYPDSVFDPDGAGGDSATKPWAINTAGNTGAYVGGGIGGYFLPGPDPLPNTTGTGKASNGGYKGAMVKFDPNTSGGFGKNETVGFSGDMDPNSIAGLTKNSLDSIAVDSWDVGGISGHELIGSTFTVLFDDGTTASGQLGSDGSASGSHAIATQNGTGAAAPTLIVNGVGAGGTGTYGGTQPSVIVSGNPGDTVMVTLTKGFNPVQGAGDIPALVENRLDAYAFKANNTFDNQHIVVKLNSSGQADISGRFDYDNSLANNKADGTFPGDDVSPIGFVAAVVDPNNGNAPISPITRPIYLTNQGGPVTGGAAGTLATTVTAIGASSSDWEQFGGGNSSVLELGLNGSRAQAVGMRFDGIDIPQTTIITDAYLQFTALATSSNVANITIGIEGNESAATFSSSAPPQSRVIVDEFAWANVEQWTAGGTYRTPDIGALIETVIGADGATNAALAFIVEGTGSRVASSFNNGDAPELVLVLDDGSALTM